MRFTANATLLSGLRIFWAPPANDSIVLEVTASGLTAGSGWWALGVGTKSMEGADIVAAHIGAGGAPRVYDMYADGFSRPANDAAHCSVAHEDWELLAASTTAAGASIWTLRRRLSAGDPGCDNPIAVDAATPFIAVLAPGSAFMDAMPRRRSKGALGFHQSNGASVVEAQDEEFLHWARQMHGYSLITTWAVVTMMGVLVARYARHAPRWLTWHMHCQLLSTALGVPQIGIAFMVQTKSGDPRHFDHTHGKLGLTIGILSSAQPVLATAMRGKLEIGWWTLLRWAVPLRTYQLCAVMHREIGWLLVTMAMAQIPLGMAKLGDLRGLAPYCAWAALTLTIVVVLERQLGRGRRIRIAPYSAPFPAAMAMVFRTGGTRLRLNLRMPDGDNDDETETGTYKSPDRWAPDAARGGHSVVPAQQHIPEVLWARVSKKVCFARVVCADLVHAELERMGLLVAVADIHSGSTTAAAPES